MQTIFKVANLKRLVLTFMLPYNLIQKILLLILMFSKQSSLKVSVCLKFSEF